MTTAAQLCQELDHNAGISGQRPLERRLADLAIWYYKNAHFLPKENLTARMDFLDKAFWVQLEVIALLLERVHAQEGSKHLAVPFGIKYAGDIRKVG